MALIQLKRLMLLCVALTALATVALTGLGNFYESTDPQRALALNPFDVDASARLIEESVLSEEPTATTDLANVARRAIRFAPLHARSYSLLAEVQRQLGNRRATDALYETALSLSKTEDLALQRTLRSALDQNDFTAAMGKLDILFRRWPHAFDAFAPAIPPLLSDPEGYDAALQMLQADPPWRGRFMSFLNLNPGSVDLAYRLQMALNGNGGSNRPREIGGTLSALIRAKDYDRAFRLFLLTQTQEDRLHAGYVFNGAFDMEPSGRPFDWAIGNSPGVSMIRESAERKGNGESSLSVQFLGKPVKQIGLSQYIYLPLGAYRLRVDIDATNLRIPKGLYFNLVCVDPHSSLVRLDVPDGSYQTRTLETNFELPNNGCRMLKLDMKTDVIAESFRYGYAGTLSIRSISIDGRTS